MCLKCKEKFKENKRNTILRNKTCLKIVFVFKIFKRIIEELF